MRLKDAGLTAEKLKKIVNKYMVETYERYPFIAERAEGMYLYDEKGENITTAEAQSSRYARSTFKWVKTDYRIRFAYEATGKLTRFTDYKDQKYRSRRITE